MNITPSLPKRNVDSSPQPVSQATQRLARDDLDRSGLTLEDARAAGILPPGVDWPSIMRDPGVPIVVTNKLRTARRLCAQGQPAIAITGVSRAAAAKLFRRLGANVIERSKMQ